MHNLHIWRTNNKASKYKQKKNNKIAENSEIENKKAITESIKPRVVSSEEEMR